MKETSIKGERRPTRGAPRYSGVLAGRLPTPAPSVSQKTVSLALCGRMDAADAAFVGSAAGNGLTG